MLLPDLSVRRPVFAVVVALLVISFGVMAFLQLSTREFPDISPPQVSVNTTYEGAAAEVIEKRITQPLEDEIGGIEGIRAIRSNSSDGRSSITVEFELERDIDSAANDVRDRVARAARRLPEEAERPQVTKADSEASPLVYVSLEASDLSVMEITDYAERYVVDRFTVLPGVASVNFYGGADRSMRIWVDRDKLSARGLSVSDITGALRRENLELPAGRLESREREFPVHVQRSYRTPDNFRELVIGTGPDGHLLRLGEVARVEEGPASNRRIFLTNGRDSMAMGVVKQSNANTVEVLDAVRAEIDAIASDLPEGMGITASGDASAFIRAAINGVYSAIGMTIALVTLVILLFLGRFRATLIPVVCIPISLFGGIIALQAFDYSINLITLLAMVLAIGLVVDDAIVVLENIYRRIEEGEAPLLAAARGAQQVGFAVIATTAVLLAVFSPVLFLQDATARLFVELATTIAFAVVVSSVMALSIVPMMCSQLLTATARPSVISRLMDGTLAAAKSAYGRSLRWALHHSWVTLPLMLVAIVSIGPLMQSLQREYVPIEDQDAVMAIATASEGTNIPVMRGIIEQLQPPLLELQKEGSLTRVLFVSPFFNAPAPVQAFARISMAPHDERDYTAFDLRKRLLAAWKDIPGIRTMVFLPSGLGQRGPNTPVQFVLQGPDYESLADWRDTLMNEARETGLFGMLTSDLKETQQQVHVKIDITRAAALGVSTREVAEALQALMTEQEVTTFSADGEEYSVIVQLEADQRVTPADIENLQVRGSGGRLVQLANVLTTDSRAGIATLNRYNRLRAVTINANLTDGVSLGDALAVLEGIVEEKLPPGVKVAYKGQSLDYKESTNDILFAFGLALLVLFLVMAAQFESFVHPVVIMVTVPLALAGGLLGLLLTGSTFNLFSQIGLLMLIGIATKNGILLVEFINQVRDEGVPFEDAIVQASVLRLRPVLMTTISTLVGAIPLVLMTGPGAAARNVVGIVVLFGVSLATVFTLYLVPAVYHRIARHTGSPEAVAREMARLEALENHSAE